MQNGKVTGKHQSFTLLDSEHHFAEHRALFHKEFQPPGLSRHRPAMIDATRRLLVRLLDTPAEFNSHLRHMTGMMILGPAYGIEVKPTKDPFVETAERASEAMSMQGETIAFVLDSFPFLKNIPTWFPGAGFRRRALKWREVVESMPKITMGHFKAAMVGVHR
jgi:cytochrome P450